MTNASPYIRVHRHTHIHAYADAHTYIYNLYNTKCFFISKHRQKHTHSQSPEHGAADWDALITLVESICCAANANNSSKHKANKTLLCVVIAQIVGSASPETASTQAAAQQQGKRPWLRAGRLLTTAGMVLDMCSILLMQMPDKPGDGDTEMGEADASEQRGRTAAEEENLIAERVQRLKDGLLKKTTPQNRLRFGVFGGLVGFGAWPAAGADPYAAGASGSAAKKPKSQWYFEVRVELVCW